MIARLIAFMKDGAGYMRLHPQLFFTSLLIFAIPFAFLASSEQFLKVAAENQERLEKDRIGLMHDVFASFLTAVNFEPNVVNEEIAHLVALNPDITKFMVVMDTPDGVMTIAAINPENMNSSENTRNFYRLALVHEGESIIVPYIENGSRYWRSYRLVRGDDREFYIFTETSLANLDALFASRMRTAYVWLFGLLAIVLLLLLRHVRLIDYGYLYREMKKANEMKDLFTNMIAHELRAPLTAMRGYASMISENARIDQNVRDQGKRIEQSAERLVIIVNDLLDVARIQSGKLSVTREHVDISSIIDAVLDALHPSAEEKHILLKTEGAKGLIIQSDQKRLHQALTNLVSNAIKYTKEGSITISLESRSDRVELRVKDTGMGIRAEDQKELFAPFFRVKNEDVSSITGTGLGMWITKQLIELMGGSIGIESIKNIGTHVVVTLPKN